MKGHIKHSFKQSTSRRNLQFHNFALIFNTVFKIIYQVKFKAISEGVVIY